MTQSYNLSQLANNLNTAGQLDATDGLVNAVPAANGGTGQSTYTVGDILYASGATALARLPDVATGNVLISGGVGAAPSYGKVNLTTAISGTLPIANGGTNGSATPTAGAVIYGTGTAYAATAAGTTGQLLTSQGSGVPIWSTVTGVTKFTSGLLAVPTAAGQYFTVAHGLGATPRQVRVVGYCNTASYGYSVGDEVELVISCADNGNVQVLPYANATNVGYFSGSAMVVGNLTNSYAATIINNTNWRIKVYAML